MNFFLWLAFNMILLMIKSISVCIPNLITHFEKIFNIFTFASYVYLFKNFRSNLNFQSKLLSNTLPHWDFLCSDRSNLNLMRWWIIVIVSFLGINSDKITVLGTKIIKLTWEIILMKMKMSARWRHCSKIFKTNLKTHISPLLNRPQGCQGCQKKDLRFLT